MTLSKVLTAIVSKSSDLQCGHSIPNLGMHSEHAINCLQQVEKYVGEVWIMPWQMRHLKASFSGLISKVDLIAIWRLDISPGVFKWIVLIINVCLSSWMSATTFSKKYKMYKTITLQHAVRIFLTKIFNV